MTEKQYYSADDIARKLGWQRDTVYTNMKSGKLPGFKIGGEWFVDPKDWDDFIAKKKRGAQT